MDDRVEPGTVEPGSGDVEHQDSADAGPTPAGRGSPEPPLPPPPPPSPPSGPGWTPPASSTGEPRLDVGSIVGRTFDTYGREWSLFLLLALPAAVASFAQALALPAPISGGYGDWSRATEADVQGALRALGEVIGMAALGSLVSGFGTLAMIVVADRMWRAEPTSVLGAVAGALRAAPRAIVLWLGAALVLGSVVIVGIVGAALFLGLAGAVGLSTFLVLALIVVVGLVVVVVRLTPVLPVLVLEHSGVLSSVSRTWSLTHGHAVMLFITGIVVALCPALGAYGSSLIATGTDSRLVAGLAAGMASLIAAPLSSIWIVIAWGDLVGGRHRDSPVVARGSGRWVSAGLVVGLGAVLLVIGIATVAGSLPSQTLVP